MESKLQLRKVLIGIVSVFLRISHTFPRVISMRITPLLPNCRNRKFQGENSGYPIVGRCRLTDLCEFYIYAKQRIPASGFSSLTLVIWNDAKDPRPL